ncbi:MULTISPECIES: hypothetical protein [unclassified Sphingomonas]|jgi:hypothetical protein|nr:MULTISPECIES: hypothetical protein [unclassified Sphingomonas]
MKLNYDGVLADAAAMWRANREVLLAVAGIFYLLPVFAFDLFVPRPAIEKLADDALMEAVRGWYAANLPWLALSIAAQLFGGAAMLVLLLDSKRPTVGQAIARVTGLLPGLVFAMFATGVLVGLGLLLIVPGLYAIGRCYLVWAVIVAEPERGPFDGFAEAMRRSRGNGWRLLGLSMAVMIPLSFLSQLLPAAPQGQVANVVTALLAGGFATVAGIAQLLLQAAAYRVIRQGI